MEFILLSYDSIHARLLNCNVIVSIHSQSVFFLGGGGGGEGQITFSQLCAYVQELIVCQINCALYTVEICLPYADHHLQLTM